MGAGTNGSEGCLSVINWILEGRGVAESDAMRLSLFGEYVKFNYSARDFSNTDQRISAVSMVGTAIGSPLNRDRRFVEGSPFEFVQEFAKFPMTDIFIGNLREVRESALNSCGHTADDGTHYTEERERARSRGRQWTQADSWGGKSR